MELSAGYIGAQFVGGIAAATFLRAMFGTIGLLGATMPGQGGYSGEGERCFRREAERRSGVKVNSSRSEATLAW